ncbi:MAG: iron ABC transporter substrate-binding protein, partial [Methanomicrobium sp.]|nr:iron ABC transporter substrate-binding protein [Methanomicrobium sp.]
MKSLVNITDGYGREAAIPDDTCSIGCSSGGPCVRYMVYMDAEDMIAGLDSGDIPSENTFDTDTRSYILANPQFADLALIGSSSGGANLEALMAINPDVIFMLGSSGAASGTPASADTLQERTGIPVIAMPSGSYATPGEREELYSSYRLIGKILGKESRAEELSAYIEATITDLEARTKDIPESEKKTVFIGGLSYGGAHGLMSTQSAYPPFIWVNVKNIAAEYNLSSIDFSKEALLYSDPEYIFIDAGTLSVQEETGGCDEIKKPLYSDMQAVKNGNVYVTLPYNYRSSNLDTILADAY